MRAALRSPLFASLALASALSLAACGGGEEKKDEDKADDGSKKKEEKKPEPEPEPEPEVPKLDLSGPLPPETNTAMFAIDGAMIPVACFDKAAGKLKSGKDCLALAPKGEQVYFHSQFGSALDTIGDPKNALCEVSDKPTSLGSPSLDTGKTYEWAVYPKSLGKTAVGIKEETIQDAALTLTEDETAKLRAVAQKARASAKDGNLRLAQRADLDWDGDGTKETFFSVVVDHPTSPDKYNFSGIVVAKGGDLGQLVVIEQTNKPDTMRLRAGVDLDGDKVMELLLGLTFDGGSADKVVFFDGEETKAIGKWTCGA